MEIRKEITRQFIELIKLYGIALIIPAILVGSQLAKAENPFTLILEGLNLPFFMTFVVAATFPPIAVWFLWLSFAHVLAVQAKYEATTPKPSSKLKRTLINRPFILAVGVLVFYPVWYQGSYGVLFSSALLFNYGLYLLVSKLFRIKANA
jgi:hypothetical protein